MRGIQEGPETSNATGIIFCHPFFEEKLIAHRVMVNFARELANRGYAVLRFDFMGQGDSDGNAEDATIESNLSDLERGVEVLREITKVRRTALIGVRFGATLAALFAARNHGIDVLTLISPVVKGGPYIEHCLRSNLATQMSTYRKIIKTRDQLVRDLMSGEMVNIDGYLLTREQFIEIKDVDLSNPLTNLPANVRIMIMQVSKNDGQNISNEFLSLMSAFQSNGNKVDVMNVKDNYFWAESKTHITEAKPIYSSAIDWLDQSSLNTRSLDMRG